MQDGKIILAHGNEMQAAMLAPSDASHCSAQLPKQPSGEQLPTALGDRTGTHVGILYDDIHFAYELFVGNEQNVVAIVC